MSNENDQTQDVPGTGPAYNTTQEAAPQEQPATPDIPPVDTTEAEAAPAAEDKPPEQPVEVPVSRIALNVTIERDIRGPKDKNSDFQQPISLLRVTGEDLNRLAQNYPKINLEKDPIGRRWFGALEEAQENAMIGNIFTRSVRDAENTDWVQSVQHEGGKIAPGRPQFASAEGQKLTGQMAIMQMSSALGIGAMVQVPLWHSGIWVTIQPPSDVKLLNMERRIAEEKIKLGRMTNGLVFSHSSVYIVNHLMTTLLDSVYDMTVKDYTSDRILELIKVTDLPVLAWGLASTIYPNGYDYRQPCVKAPDKCKHITEEKLNISRLFFFDQKGILPEQRRHMADRKKKHEVAEIVQYQTLGKGGDGRVIELNDDIKIVLKVPSVKDYIRSGFTWIESIERMIGEVMTGRPTDKEKDDFITQQSIVTVFRQYAHWVSKIIFRDNGEIDDIETIEETLSLLSSDQKLYEKFFEEVKKYIEDSTVALIALPSYDCPACGTPMTPEESKHPNLIPLDPVSLFFTLARRRLDRTRVQ